ncbi:unnamed protein product [Prorocentrum cordatum]|uniref:Endonuclease/exonuclease/phosphatase domain-containing protein n=1 Tax=Prorocentrum cordatum TaxID=2364126 RepID=A0ABN9Q8A9_9DINO|nr:unnamed protein product [Polarella glacialis]
MASDVVSLLAPLRGERELEEALAERAARGAERAKAESAGTAMGDASGSTLAADLVGPGGDGGRSASSLSREGNRVVATAARAAAGGERRGGSGGVAKKKDNFEAVTANGSGWAPPTQLRQEEPAGAGLAESHRADAWLIQETHLHARDISVQEAWCRRAGVKAVLAPGAAGSGDAIYLANDTVGDVSQRAHIEIGDALVSQGRPRVLGGDFNAAADSLRDKALAASAASSPAAMEKAHLRAMRQAEARLCCACHIDDPLDVQVHCGRGLEPEERRVAPPPDRPQISGGPKSRGGARHLLAVADYLDDAAAQRHTWRRAPARAAKCRGARLVAALAAVAVATADALAAPAAEARRGAAAPAAEHSRRRHERFNKWVLEALEHGAGGLHARRRGPRGWQEDELDLRGAPRAGQREAGAIDEHWVTEVCSTADGSDGRQESERQSNSEALPRPTADEWLDAAESFAKRTGMGIDRASPRALAQVSAATADLFADVGMAAEEFSACSSGELKSEMHIFYDDATVACHGRTPRAMAKHLVEAGFAAAMGLAL